MNCNDDKQSEGKCEFELEGKQSDQKNFTFQERRSHKMEEKRSSIDQIRVKKLSENEQNWALNDQNKVEVIENEILDKQNRTSFNEDLSTEQNRIKQLETELAGEKNLSKKLEDELSTGQKYLNYLETELSTEQIRVINLGEELSTKQKQILKLETEVKTQNDGAFSLREKFSLQEELVDEQKRSHKLNKEVEEYRKLIQEIIVNKHEYGDFETSNYGNVWTVKSRTGICVATLKLFKQYPRNFLVVKLPSSTPTPPELKLMLKRLAASPLTNYLRLFLHHSYDNCAPCDDSVVEISRAKFRLDEFRGCVKSEAAVLALLRVVHRANFHLSLSDNPTHHHIRLLADRIIQLYVRVPFTSITDGQQESRPLPKANDRLELIIDDVPADGAQKSLALIEALAPSDKKYSAIRLPRCQMNEEALQQMRGSVTNSGIETDAMTIS